MRKIVLFGLFVYFSLTGLQAQESLHGGKRIDVFVYSDSSVTTSLNALRSELTHELVNSADSSYIVTDRTEEIWKYLRQELDYQESGYVRDDQLIKIGEHFGASYLCVVGVTNYQEYNEFFFEGTVVDIAARTVEKHSQYPDDGSKVEKLDPQTQIKVGKDLARQLGFIDSTKESEKIYKAHASWSKRVRCD